MGPNAHPAANPQTADRRGTPAASPLPDGEDDRVPGPLGGTWSRLRRDALEPRLMIIRRLPHAGPWLLTALVLINLCLGVLPVAFVIATSIVVGRVPASVTGGVGSAAWDVLVTAFLVAAGIFVAQQVLAPTRVALGELLKRRIDQRVHHHVMAAALRSPGIGPMEDQRALDALHQADRGLADNFETPGMACAGMLALIARYTQLLGYACSVGVVASWTAAGALVVATMVFRYGNRGGLRKYAQINFTIVGAFRRSSYLRDVALQPNAAKELRVFGLTGWLTDRYEAMYRAWVEPQARARRKIYVAPYLLYTAAGLLIAGVVLVLIARAAVAGSVTLTGTAIALQASVAALMLGEQYPEADQATQKGMLAVRGLDTFERLARGYEERAAAPATTSARVSPATVQPATVTFARVSFRYPGGSRPVHDGLDLELPAGRSTAVVGVNGAGKTTLVKLLTRLYDPVDGHVRFGGVDIREFSVDEWRRQISVVFQDFVRYEMTVADNIALGAPHVPPDRDRVRRAAERANALDVVERLPMGFDTPLSPAYAGGTDLSGGQWQRIAIARSLYALDAGARVLVLDEPTSALDVRAEAEFFDQFVELTRGVTSLLISHRFSSVRRADSIAVVERGRVLEQGSHDALLAADGRYAELFRLQAERFAAGLDAEGEPVDRRGDGQGPAGGGESR